jgi:chemotaxis protein CheD
MSSPSLWVIPTPRKVLIAGVADMVASNDGSGELVTYALGSCLGVVVYDPVVKVGGLLHLMLPDSAINPGKGMTNPFMFVDTGVPKLFHAVYGLGGEKSRLIVKIAGGAQFLDEKKVFNIGERNWKAIELILARNGVRISAADVGGRVSRTIRLDLNSGRLSVQVPGTDLYTI